MNWGYRIALVTLTFVGFMTFLVVSAFRQRFDLVTEDYYGKELKFQQQIDKQVNYLQLKQAVVCEENDSTIVLHFPDTLRNQTIAGELVLFRPSDAAKDVHLPLQVVQGTQLINKGPLIKGLYNLQLDYSAGGKLYYFEQELMVH